MPITTAIMPQFVYNFVIYNDYISIVRFQPFELYIVLCCSALIFYILRSVLYMLMRKLVLHLMACWHDHYTYIPQKLL